MQAEMDRGLLSAEKDPEAFERMLISIVGSYASDIILDVDQRRQHKEQCLERLRAQDNTNFPVHYAEQAILANLDWGVGALDEAIETSSEESKKARLQHAEKLLLVSALLESKGTTAGVPNTYLSAWAHLNLALVWKLRNDDRAAAMHVMDMYLVDPCCSRLDFAPALWEHLFLPQLATITTSYSDQRRGILLGDSSGGEVSSQRDQLPEAIGQRILSSMSQEQASQLQQLETLYQASLDDHTRCYARHYKNLLVSNSTKRGDLSPVADISSEFGNSEWMISGSKEPELSAIHKDRRGSNTRSGGDLRSKDFLINLNCNPIWEEQNEALEESNNSFNLQKTKFYALDASEADSLHEDHSKGGIDSPWSLEEVLSSRHPHVEHGKLESLSMEKRPKFQDSYLQEEQQQEISDFSTSMSPVDIYSHPSLRSHYPYRSPLSTSSDAESDLGMEDPRARSLQKVESMDLEHRRRSLSSCSSLSHIRENAKSTIADQALYHNSQAKANYLGEFEKENLVNRPPKDFVCAITGQLFNDPVTLETGQTYERGAIQELLDQGSSICPITRQTLRNTTLPKTNYVLKRLVASWKEQNPDISQELDSFSRPETLPSQTFHPKLLQEETSIGSAEGSPWSTSSSFSRVAQFTQCQSAYFSQEVPLEKPSLIGMVNDLKQIISMLCNSEDFEECEESLLAIKRLFSEGKVHQHIKKYLSEAGVIESIVEILCNSTSAKVLQAGVVVLSGLVESNGLVKKIILKADGDLDCVVGLLRGGFPGAATLLHQLKLPSSQIMRLNLIHDLIRILREGTTTQDPGLFLNPRTAALNILCELVWSEDLKQKATSVKDITSTDSMLSLIQCLKEKNSKENLKVLSLLLYCIKSDGECRNFIAHEIEIVSVLELLNGGNSTARLVTISFLSELVRQCRRTANNSVLKHIKEEGTMSSMHMLLAHLQLAPPEQRPLIASLLLQLDLLEEPRKRSMYRDEAVEAIIKLLDNKESVAIQVTAAETLVALLGRFSTSGKPSTEAWLLKIANLEDSTTDYADKTQICEWVGEKEEETALKEWEKRMAKALLGYEQGEIINALSQHLLSRTPELLRSCMITAVWLLRMIPLLPDTGLRTSACHFLLTPFLSILKSSKKIEKQVLSVLAIQSCLDHSESLQKIARHAKEICGPLRQLQRKTWVAKSVFSTIVNEPSVDATELWVHEDVGQMDLSQNGAIRAFARARGHIFSGHSDGTIKVWDGKSRLPSFVHETKQHTKAVTSLAVSQTTERLYSGSLDKTVRVWTFGSGKIQCIQTLEQKDGVNAMLVNGHMTCIVPQSAGIQVQYENCETSTLNLGKHVQSVAYSEGKIYCGCIDSSIQELDTREGSTMTIQSSAKTLIGKKPIYALQVFKSKIFAAGAPLDGMAVKVWSQANKCLVGHIASTSYAEIRTMLVNEDFIYLGTNTGIVEVWLLENLTKLTSFNVGSKITCLVLNGNMLLCGSEDGKMRMFVSS